MWCVETMRGLYLAWLEWQENHTLTQSSGASSTTRSPKLNFGLGARDWWWPVFQSKKSNPSISPSLLDSYQKLGSLRHSAQIEDARGRAAAGPENRGRAFNRFRQVLTTPS